MTNAEAWFNIALRPRKPEGSLGRTAQDGHLDSHTAPELEHKRLKRMLIYYDNTERTMFRGKPPFQATKQRRGRRRRKKEKNIHTQKHTVKR